MAWYSKTWTWLDGEWHEGNPPIMGPRSHASWLGSSVFDGARIFEGVAPDLDRHAARVNRSAQSLGLKPTMTAEEIIGLTHEGAKKFADFLLSTDAQKLLLNGSMYSIDKKLPPPAGAKPFAEATKGSKALTPEIIRKTGENSKTIKAKFAELVLE